MQKEMKKIFKLIQWLFVIAVFIWGGSIWYDLYKNNPNFWRDVRAALPIPVKYIIPDFDERKKVNFIKSSTMSSCKNKTTGKMIDDFMGDEKWSKIKSKDGKEYVNVEGNITYREKKITALIQFSLNKNSFSVHAVTYNEIPQNQFMINSLFKAMCDSSSIKRAQ